MNRFWLDRTVLVTGATGLLGGWMVRHLLSQGADITCVVRDWEPHAEFVRSRMWQQMNVVRGDIRDQDLMERVLGERETEVVIHLAAQAIVPVANRNPVSTFESNVRGTWTLLEACRRSPRVRSIVVASSDKAYGSSATLPYDESTPLRGLHPYDVSKCCADLIAQSYAATYRSRIAITRCGNFFGGGDLQWNRLVPGTIRSILRGERPVLRSNGQQVRDYLYVEDGVAAYLEIAERLASDDTLIGEAFNVSYEAPLSALAMVEQILNAMGSRATPEIRGDATHEIPAQWLTAAKLRSRLGFVPRVGFVRGLADTVAWYERFLAPSEPRLTSVRPPPAWSFGVEAAS